MGVRNYLYLILFNFLKLRNLNLKELIHCQKEPRDCNKNRSLKKKIVDLETKVENLECITFSSILYHCEFLTCVQGD